MPLGGQLNLHVPAADLLFLSCLWAVCLYPALGQDAASKPYCRTILRTKPYECPLESYDDFTCMVCYYNLPPTVFKEGRFREFIIKANSQCDYGMFNRSGIMYPATDFDYKNESSAIYDTLTKSGKRFWRDCCLAARKCCAQMLESPTKSTPGSSVKYCPKTFDGWQCFDETEAGQIHESFCEDHIHFLGDPPKCKQTLTRRCGDDGKWPGFNNTNDTEWTDYKICSPVEPLRKRHQAHVAAYIVSICALTPALIIFFSYKQLRVPRITIHKNLFLSLLFNGVVLITFKYLIILKPMDQERDGISGEACRFLFALTKYTRATNYMWMFCEGLYLLKLIVAAFSEQKNLLIYYILGWGLPVIPVLIYSILRITDPEAYEKCWGQHLVPKYEWVVSGPNLLSLVINFLFLFNIIRVLVTKLRTAHTNDPHKQYRKAVRATLVLVPLFGLHFCVTAYRPEIPSCFWLEFYYYLYYITDGSQGFLVALIFCYLNGEVLYLLQRSFRRWRLQRMPEELKNRRVTGTTVSTVMSSSDHSDSSNQSGHTMELKMQKFTANGRRP